MCCHYTTSARKPLGEAVFNRLFLFRRLQTAVPDNCSCYKPPQPKTSTGAWNRTRSEGLEAPVRHRKPVCCLYTTPIKTIQGEAVFNHFIYHGGRKPPHPLTVALQTTAPVVSTDVRNRTGSEGLEAPVKPRRLLCAAIT